MAAMAAFTFSSCEDVPEPYNLPQQPETPTLDNDGSEEKPYTVTDAQTVKAATGKYVTGYIVAYVASGDTKLSNAKFASAASEENTPTNILIAASADETDYNKCMPVALPYGDIRTGLNLKDHADYYKQQVTLYGDITTYFGAVGLMETSYAKVAGKEIGTKPSAGGDTPAAGEAKGTGTEADPFNSVAAQNKAKSLDADQTTDETFYIKGKIQKFANNGEFGAKYGNASFYIADDESSEQFYVYQVYYFGGEKWKEGDQQLKVGDEVVVCAKLSNYKGNTPETAKGGKLISINGKTSGSTESGGTETPDTPAGSNIEMTTSTIESGKSGSVSLPEKTYETQDVTKEDTWYTWNNGGVTFKGAKITKAETGGDYAGTLQMQGNKDVAKQGFLFNSTAFAKDIKSITLIIEGSASNDKPTTFSVYEGTTAHPAANKVEGKYTKASKNDKVNQFTITYDFSSVSSKYFTIWNNAAGALYIEKIIVTLK